MRGLHALVVSAALLLAPAVAAEPELKLSLPLDCEPGKTCFLQHYVDIDSGSAARDFRCGSATYDGHKGTDFRLLSTAAARRGVRVLAAAPGIVKGMRDSMEDAIARESGGKPSVSGVECGNGLVIDHGNGWETQYCHMRRGSLRVKPGDRIGRGQHLGDVGWSGLADFAHLHLTVRKDGKEIDPFSGRPQDGACAAGAQASLWEDSARDAFPYVNGAILQTGFTDRRFSSLEIERDHGVALPRPESPEIVLFARFMNLRLGDQVRMRMSGPGGFRFDATGAPADRNKQIDLSFAVRERKVARWPAGRYEGLVELIRDGTVIAQSRATLDLS
jgi:hypothetical protein